MIDAAQATKVQDDMIKLARAHSVPIAGVREDRQGKHLGSGTVVNLRGRPYLLTCDHIARDAKQIGSVVMGLGNLVSPITVISPIQPGDDTYDVAVARLEVNWLLGGNIQPLPASRLAENSICDKDEPLFVYGFPTFKEAPLLTANFGRDAGRWTSTPAIILRRQFNITPFCNERMHFTIHYSAKEFKANQKVSGELTPYGFSGSAVWSTGVTRLGAANWSPDSPHVIGMAIQWHECHEAFVCLRIEVIRQFLMWALTKEAAYFRWVERGSPSDDSWADWFAAESVTKQLD